MAVAPNWLYDFGDLTSTALAALPAPDPTQEITAAKSAAVTMINSGAFGSTTASYRVQVRADANSPTGYALSIALT